MQDLLNSKSNNEINLLELSATMWAYKLFIAGMCALGIVIGGYYVLNADKQFSSSAIFKLDQEKYGMSIGGELNAIASLAGLGNADNDSTLPTDQVAGRVFIQDLDAELNFQADSYFNKYNPNPIDPIWKSLIKRAIGWQKSSIDVQEAIWQSIIKEYSKNVVLNETDGGSVKLTVTHANPQRAAMIANSIMNKIISDKLIQKNTEQDQRLTYLSNTLAKALNDLEVSQSNLKEFALENSAMPLKDFTVENMQLDALREKLSRTNELYEAVAAISLILKNKTTDQKDYLLLRQKFPIVDRVEFRRIMGQNEIISTWSWPAVSTVDAVHDTLSDRKRSLTSKINTSLKNAERSALALNVYAKLERETQVAEATYTVLIEQVKAQSMIAGYRPDKTVIYEFASAAITPSAPKRTLILALGATLGLFFGISLALIMALRLGVYYSKKSLIDGVQARFAASLKTLLPLRNQSLEELSKMLMKKSRPVLRDMAVEIHKSAASQVVLTSSRTKMTSNCVARALASYMQSNSTKVAVINFSSKAKKLDIDEKRLSVRSFDITESLNNISVLTPRGDLSAMETLSHKSFWNEIQSLNSTYNLVFLCSDNGDAISLLSALEGQVVLHLTLARTKKTKSATLAHMHSLIPIKGLLHD
jgi:uncharacterized protein involved in exopolysaccharide biosynthesis